MRRWSFWVVLAVMILVNTATRELSDWLSVPAAALGVAVLLGIGRWDGLSWEDLGLSPAALRRGLASWRRHRRRSSRSFYAAVLVSPWDSALESSRTPDTSTRTLLFAFVIIPIQTVIWEEVAFRGVLWAHVRRDHGTWMATVISSVLFGLWHVLPAAGFAASSSAVTDNTEGGTTTTRHHGVGHRAVHRPCRSPAVRTAPSNRQPGDARWHFIGLPTDWAYSLPTSR